MYSIIFGRCKIQYNFSLPNPVVKMHMDNELDTILRVFLACFGVHNINNVIFSYNTFLCR